jgi:hypothetical protein
VLMHELWHDAMGGRAEMRGGDRPWRHEGRVLTRVYGGGRGAGGRGGGT